MNARLRSNVLLAVASFAILATNASAAGTDLIDPVRETIHGHRIISGCAYTVTLSLAPHETAVARNEISRDDITCTMVLERGTPRTLPIGTEDGYTTESGSASASDGVATARAAQLNGEVGPQDRRPRPSAGGAHATRSALGNRRAGPMRSAATTSAGYYRSWWEDPFAIDVNSVNNNVRWTWNGSSVSNGSCGYSLAWFSDSGWHKVSSSFNCYYGSGPAVYSESDAHYRNGRFCASVDTDVRYSNNRARGGYAGGLTGSVTAWVDGGCESMLHFHDRLVRTQ